MAGFQKNERSKAYHYKSNSLNLLRYGGIIQRNCHFKIHAQFLVHGIDQFSLFVNSVSCNYTFVIFFKAAYIQTPS